MIQGGEACYILGVYAQALENSAGKRQGRGFRPLLQSDTVSRIGLARP